MQELKVVMDSYTKNKWYCEITEKMDEYLINNSKRSSYKTYIMLFSDRMELDNKPGELWTIRCPGATRGYLLTNDEKIIEDIKFYEYDCFETGCYDRKMVEIKDKYVGYKLTI